ncbi:hypothetical protein MMC10_003395 [Thelotrema lepadinum]|nr:hypothetical protein [Thelotrema lepadinum]
MNHSMTQDVLESSEEVQPCPLASQAFSDNLREFAYQPPSPSPIKRKAPGSEDLSPPPNKRVTRAASASSLKSAAISKQPVFPPPVNLSPSPRRPDKRSVSTPSPAKTPSSNARKVPKVSPASPASPSPQTNLLTDELGPDLHIMFVGVNPGIQTATTGFAYAHPSNLFYPLLHLSGITSQRCLPSEYRSLVKRFRVGNTNVVTRPTKDASMLSRTEMDAGVPVVEEKARLYKPGCVVLVGKGIWETFERVWKREGRIKPSKHFEYGWQDMWLGKDEEWEGARVFAATSTSGRAITPGWDEKVRIWEELGNWYKERTDTKSTVK